MEQADLRKQFAHLIKAKDYNALETLWLEIITQPNISEDLSLLFDLVRPLYAKSAETALLFLSILKEHIKETGNYSKTLAVLKETATAYAKAGINDKKIRSELTDYYRKLYAKANNLEGFIRKSELLDNREILSACELLEQYLSFDVGSYVYNQDNGVGKVENVDLLLDRIFVKFFSVKGEKTILFPFAQAFKNLIALPDDNFLVLKYRSSQILKEQAKTDQLALFKLLLKSVKKPLKINEIKNFLSGIVAEQEWNNFWDKMKKLIMNDAHILVKGLPERTYSYSETPIPKTKAKVVSSKIQTSNMEPIPKLEEQILKNTKKETVQMIDATKNFTLRKKLLSLIKQKRIKDWPEIYSMILLATQDKKTLALIKTELASFDPNFLSSVLTNIFLSYRSYPGQFVWLATQDINEQFSKKSFLSRFLDILSSSYLRPYWSGCKKLMVAKNYRFTQSGISEMSESEIQSFWEGIKSLKNLEESHKVEIKRIIKNFHPEFEKSEDADLVYSTVEGINKKQAELKELLTVSIPKSAQEIARAREFGDLSENYEYKAAKEKQARLVAKAGTLRAELKRAKPINFVAITTETVTIGTKIKLQEINSEAIEEYTILGPYDIVPEQRIISYLAPFAKLLLGKKVGDLVPANSDDQSAKNYKIIAITKAR